jgi:hypothetical protein
VLRLPYLSQFTPGVSQELEAQLPNCLIVEARETCIDEAVLHTARH